ncbi:hypothetical protein ZHAS_00003460 [Anopheles sinensis]|uniref:Uncharacterized protein n=1 Tax=Anopheles sinensis TaxID=74873 RepID=A0A084VEE1_ANOSI|nr:hypothetical protein ZHAS_00003460 [Anopheles sinensis]
MYQCAIDYKGSRLAAALRIARPEASSRLCLCFGVPQEVDLFDRQGFPIGPSRAGGTIGLR